MVFDSNFERFVNELLKQNSTQYVSLCSFTQQRLEQLALHEIYTAVEVIQIIHYRIRNVDRPEKPIQNPPMHVRRVCLKVLSELKQLHIAEKNAEKQSLLSSECLDRQWCENDSSQHVNSLYLALAALSKNDRQILYLRYMKGMGWAEIVNSLATPNSMQQSSTLDLQQMAEQALKRLRKLYRDLTNS